jgi:hypothetical protein
MTQKEWLERIEEKLDKIQEHTVSIKVDVAKNTADLNYHIMRTDLLEQKLESETAAIYAKVERENEEVRKDIKPIQRHITGIKWLIGSILTMAAFGSALATILNWF